MDMQTGVVVKSDSMQLNSERSSCFLCFEPHNSEGRGKKLGGRRGEKNSVRYI